jgi:hypothetical protein
MNALGPTGTVLHHGDATAATLERHFRAMLPEARVLSLDDLSGELWVGCVDGRHPGCVAGAPGGNAGLLVLLLAAWENEAGRALEPAEVEALFLDYLDEFGAFYLHTDRSAQDRLALALSRRGPERVEPGAAVDARVRAPGPEWEGPLLEALPLPNHVGCGHLRLLLEEPERYEVRPALVEEVIRSFFRRLWTGDPRLVLDILEGEHEEVAVVQVRTEGAPGLVTACPHFGATDLFVHHPEAVARLHALHAAFLARSGRIPAERVPKVLRFQEDLGVRHVETTLGRLAPGLPVFDVHLQASSRERPSSVEVRSAGRVPHPQELHGGRPQP